MRRTLGTPPPSGETNALLRIHQEGTFSPFTRDVTPQTRAKKQEGRIHAKERMLEGEENAPEIAHGHGMEGAIEKHLEHTYMLTGSRRTGGEGVSQNYEPGVGGVVGQGLGLNRGWGGLVWVKVLPCDTHRGPQKF